MITKMGVLTALRPWKLKEKEKITELLLKQKL